MQAVAARVLYLDLIGGISGDMTVAALLDLGVPMKHLHEGMEAIGLPQLPLEARTERRHGIAGLRFRVGPPAQMHAKHVHAKHVHAEHGAESAPGAQHPYVEIRRCIAQSGLPYGVCVRAQAIFAQLARAESAAHRVPLEAVQFHEVGAWDSLADIVCTAIALEHLGIETIFCSRVPLGGGQVHCAHGIMPVPAPATLRLLEGFAVECDGLPWERTTPTGAAILAALARPAGHPFCYTPQRIGVGIGTAEREEIPNLLRAVICTWDAAAEKAQARKKNGATQGASAQCGGEAPATVASSGKVPFVSEAQDALPQNIAPQGTWDTPLTPNIALRDVAPIDVVERDVVECDGVERDGVECDEVECAEANLDDAPAEWLGYLLERLLECGALDVSLLPAQMKKNRPGTLVRVLYAPQHRTQILRCFFLESTTLGVRCYRVERFILPRRAAMVHTPYGAVQGKVSVFQGRKHFAPEFDSCRHAAENHARPLREIYLAAQLAYAQQNDQA